MNPRSVAAIRYLDARELKEWICQGVTSQNESFQVIDARGSDYIGGHIAKCWNYPYRDLRDNETVVKELRERLKNRYDGIINCVFHCAQSQQRGPAAAMLFLRSLPDHELASFRIWILRGGFIHWQQEYGEDPALTEAYNRELWSM
ncbi:LAMI_0A08020g1_1 [Lachancea mirantina]|uniref:LAMI_0A08020g1_1 n=1 Tax=Lachancea mirantina TaxID=1230905 RepID=A0A1G4IR33_9SACH|nr:LAMI_0A08020g1_1 [Lachancea mirantina]